MDTVGLLSGRGRRGQRMEDDSDFDHQEEEEEEERPDDKKSSTETIIKPSEQRLSYGSDGGSVDSSRDRSEHSETSTGSNMSVLDQKMRIVNRELDDMGMGKYQWCIFFLCCFGYFLDLAWAGTYCMLNLFTTLPSPDPSVVLMLRSVDLFQSMENDNKLANTFRNYQQSF